MNADRIKYSNWTFAVLNSWREMMPGKKAVCGVLSLLDGRAPGSQTLNAFRGFDQQKGQVICILKQFGKGNAKVLLIYTMGVWA